MPSTREAEVAPPVAADPPRRSKPAARRTRRRLGPGLLAGQLLVAVVLFAGWELGARAGVVDPFFFSRPSDIARQVGDWFVSGEVYPHLLATLAATLLAFVIGVVGGLGFGVLFARVPLLARLLDPYMKMLNALPRLVLAPIFLLWFGIGIWSKVALGVTLVFFVVFFNTLEGIRNVSSVLVDNARMLGAREIDLLRGVYVPSALSWIFSSLHVSIGFAIIGAVIGEYLGATHGIGYLIAQAQGVFDTTSVFAGMVVLIAFVLVIEGAVTLLERRLLRWRAAGKR